MTHRPIRPYPRNVEGDFYIEDGCCITCGVMHDTAEGLIAWDNYLDSDGSQGAHCYVSRQPASPVELEALIAATDVTEAGCVRYRGEDPKLLRRFVERGQSELIDGTPPAGVVPLSRHTMRLEMNKPVAPAAELAHEFVAYAAERWKVGFQIDDVDGASVTVDSRATISFRDQDDATMVTLERTPDERSFNVLTGLLHDWQAQKRTVKRVQWLTAIELAGGAEGQPRPS